MHETMCAYAILYCSTDCQYQYMETYCTSLNSTCVSTVVSHSQTLPTTKERVWGQALLLFVQVHLTMGLSKIHTLLIADRIYCRVSMF